MALYIYKSPRCNKESDAIANKVLEVIREGKAPPAAKLAAAKGLFPLSNEEMLEVLVTLGNDADAEIRQTAAATLDTMDGYAYASLAADPNAPANVLGFLCLWQNSPRPIREATILNRTTPDAALARLAVISQDAAIVEAISLKQQSLIDCPDIIEAILHNPVSSLEAQRRVTEAREEFFEKRFGVQMVAEERRVQAEAAAAKSAKEIFIDSLDDLVRLGLIDETADLVDDSLIEEYEAEVGFLDEARPQPEEQIDYEAIIGEVLHDEDEYENKTPAERKAMFQMIALMSIKERVLLGMKGTREARMILVRDPNRLVASSVLRNPRLTEQEVESISTIRALPEEVLRLIAMNRAWTRSYLVIHNLVKNPRTPIAMSLNFLNRIQTRDLRNLASNKNIPDVIRTMANRMYLKRSGT